MAKTTQAKKPTARDVVKGRSREVAARPKSEVSADNVDIKLLMKQDAGRGVSTAAEDNIIPLIYILQAQSPQVLKQKPEYIKGAEAGAIWPRGTKHLIDGENDGLPVIPVAFRKWWMEWGAERGDGMFGRHEYDAAAPDKGRPADAVWHEDPKKPGKGQWVRDNGHILVETREHAVLALINDNWTGAVVSMQSTNHACSRTWMGLMKDKRIPDSEDRAPSYAYVYCLKTTPRSNDQGDWYAWTVEDGTGDGEVVFLPSIEDGVSLYKTARQLDRDFMSGAKVADAPEALDPGASGSREDRDGDM